MAAAARRDRTGSPSAWALWRMPPRALALIVTAELVAVLGLIANAMVGPPPTWADGLTALMLVVGGIVHTEIARWGERTRRKVTPVRHIDLTSVWTFSSALILPTAIACGVVLATYAYVHARVLRPSRTPIYRQLYSTSTVLLSVQAVGLLLRLTSPPSLVAGWGLMLLPASAVLYTLVNSSLIVAVIVLATPEATVRAVVGRGSEVAVELATLVVGTFFAVVVTLFGLLGLVVALPATLLLQWAILDWQLAAQAGIDERVGLHNAAAWYKQAKHLLSRTNQHTGVSAALVVELDQGTEIEKTYGRELNTDALRVVAEAILDVTTRRDAVGWFGESMFALVVPDTDGRSLAMRIQSAVARRPVLLHTPDGPLTVALTVTIGVAEAPRNGRTATAVLEAAEVALDRARKKGRGSQHFTDEAI